SPCSRYDRRPHRHRLTAGGAMRGRPGPWRGRGGPCIAPPAVRRCYAARTMTPDDVRDTLARFPRERTWLLPALREVQHAERWLSPDALDAVAAHLRVPASEVWGVATHYPELRLARPGRRIVRVCTGVACAALGARELLTRCQQRFAVRAGETAADGSATVEELDCAFACAVGPVIEIDHIRRGRVTMDELDAAL